MPTMKFQLTWSRPRRTITQKKTSNEYKMRMSYEMEYEKHHPVKLGIAEVAVKNGKMTCTCVYY